MRTLPILVLIFSGALCAGGGAAATAAAAPTETQLRALRERIEKATRQVSHDAVERDRLSQSLRTAELSLGGARGELDHLQGQFSDRSARRTRLAAERDRQQAELARERDALAGQLRAAYMLGREEPLKLLLNQQDPLHSSRVFSYYGYFGRARAAQIGAIEAHVQKIDELDASLAAEQDRLQELKSAQQAQLAALERARNDRQKVLASLTLEAGSRSLNLTRLKGQQADLEKLLKELNGPLRSIAPADNATAFGRLRGQLGWPVAGHLVADFGATRASGVKWDGVVVATALDTPVKAVADGRVVYADWLPGLGLLVIVDHGEGYLSLYGHNDRLYKAAGERVGAGDVIAGAGDTGGRSEPALYFEIRRSGKPVDPRPWFRQRNP